MNKPLIMSIVTIFLSLSLVLGFYFVDKLETKTIIKEIIKEVPVENCPEKTPYDYNSKSEFNLKMNSNFESFINCETYKCTANVEGFGKLVSFTDFDDFNHNTFIINGKIVNTNYYLTDIKFLNDNIFVIFKRGADISGTGFGVYDETGKEIVYYSILDHDINNIPDSFGYYIKRQIEATNSKIVFEATTLYHGDYCNKEICFSICNKGEWSKLKDGANTVVTKSYTLNYLGNDKYSDPIVKNIETLQDAYDEYISLGACE